jgi:endonuclease/exonuclease/phosphatase family metal-dependent hydrolase
LFIAALVGAHAWSRPRLWPHWPRSVPVAIEDPSGLRVVTWNIRNLGSEQEAGRDEAELARRLAGLQADVLALQEIHDRSVLARVLPDHRILMSRGAGGHGQHVVIAYAPDRVDLVRGPFEDDRLTENGRVRPALWAELRSKADGRHVVVIAVHLKARAEGHAVRQRQWTHLTTLVREIEAAGAPTIIVAGDFNATGAPGGAPGDELERLDAVFATVGLTRTRSVEGCTAYWDGVRRDRWYEPSLLDLIWINPPDPPTAHVGGHCALHRCRPFASSPAYPDRSLQQSDHCPTWIDL